jgi:hypothetical protein
MAHSATYEVRLSHGAAKQAQDDFDQATQGGGAFSLPGTPIALPGSKKVPVPTYRLSMGLTKDFQQFTVERDRGGQPMVLAIVGRKLPQVGGNLAVKEEGEEEEEEEEEEGEDQYSARIDRVMERPV